MCLSDFAFPHGCYFTHVGSYYYMIHLKSILFCSRIIINFEWVCVCLCKSVCMCLYVYMYNVRMCLHDCVFCVYVPSMCVCVCSFSVVCAYVCNQHTRMRVFTILNCV